MGRRRRRTGITDLLSDITDDIKNFIDDDVVDRGRETEQDLRRASSDLTREDSRSRRDARGNDRRDSGTRQAEIDDLRRAVRTLSAKVNALTEPDSGASADDPTPAGRIDIQRGSEPWPGYDEQTVVDIRKKLSGADEATAHEVRAYEARHKNRRGVLDAAGALKNH